MRRTSLTVVVAVVAILAFSLMLAPLVGATNAAAPLLQTTGTAVGTEAATTTAATAAATEAATTTAATEAATAATTGAATPTRSATNLPNTGGDSGMSALLLGAAALVLIGVAAALLIGRRRDTTL